ncbi:MAG: FkbM family methyltransferase [Verrucomicrobiota bacterium]
MTDSIADPVLTLPNGLHLSLLSRRQKGCAQFIAKEVFRNGAYSRTGFEIRPTDIVVDIGANIGVFALWAAPQAHEGRVICVEPTKVIKCLENSLANNNLSNVFIVKCAISDQPGNLELLEYPGFNAVSHSAVFQPSGWGQFFIKLLWRKQQAKPLRVVCPCRTMDSILDEYNVSHVDFLKVDCEGGEYSIFDSVSTETLSRISKIAMEFHELHPSHDHRRIVQRLREAGFRVEVKRSLFERLFLKTGMLWATRN